MSLHVEGRQSRFGSPWSDAVSGMLNLLFMDAAETEEMHTIMAYRNAERQIFRDFRDIIGVLEADSKVFFWGGGRIVDEGRRDQRMSRSSRVGVSGQVYVCAEITALINRAPIIFHDQS